MERFILRQNITIFQRALQTETDAAECRIVQQMLADATAELARLDALADEPPGLGGSWSASPRCHYGKSGEVRGKLPRSPRAGSATGGE